jgi:hypothetical protein
MSRDGFRMAKVRISAQNAKNIAAFSIVYDAGRTTW